jgi:molybdopterin converting factor small subunit
MKIQVKLFATLSRFSPGGLSGTPFEVELKEEATLQDLADQLGLPAEETKVAYVNGIARPLGYVLKSGDDTGIFPPIGGG